VVALDGFDGFGLGFAGSGVGGEDLVAGVRLAMGTAAPLAGLLAATRTGLTPAGDDELTNPKIHHGVTSRCHAVLLSARKGLSSRAKAVMSLVCRPPSRRRTRNNYLKALLREEAGYSIEPDVHHHIAECRINGTKKVFIGSLIIDGVPIKRDKVVQFMYVF